MPASLPDAIPVEEIVEQRKEISANDEAFNIIGRIIVYWAALEDETQRSIWYLLNFMPSDHDTLGRAITSHIPFRVRLDIISSLINDRLKDQALINEGNQLIKEILDAQTSRNLVAHGTNMFHIPSEGVHFSRTQSRKKVETINYVVSVDTLDEFSGEVIALGIRLERWGWRVLRSYFSEGYPHRSDAERTEAPQGQDRK